MEITQEKIFEELGRLSILVKMLTEENAQLRASIAKLTPGASLDDSDTPATPLKDTGDAAAGSRRGR